MFGTEIRREAAAGPVKAAIADAMVGIFKELYGLGPTATRVFLEDDFVFVVLHGMVTRNERTLLEAGEHQLVREYRLRFQEIIAETSKAKIAAVTGRHVLAHHSQIVFDPDMTFEVFALEPRHDAAAVPDP